MIVTIGTTKGGVGKSTLATNAAIGRAIEGRRVWLIDGDRQATSHLVMQARAQAGHLPLMPCDHLPDGEALHAKVMAEARNYDDVVIDAGGRDSSALRAALLVSDVLLVPTAPRALDFWALDDMAPLIAEARRLNPALRVLVALNCADTTGSDNKAAAEALAALPSMEYLDAPVTRRKSIAAASAQGLSVLELKPKDKKAIAEVQSLIAGIFK